MSGLRPPKPTTDPRPIKAKESQGNPSQLKCENCEAEILPHLNEFILNVSWEDEGRETGIPFGDDLYFSVCSVKCGVELIGKMKLDIDKAAELSIKRRGLR